MLFGNHLIVGEFDKIAYCEVNANSLLLAQE